jgi:hypothetical protein
MTLRKMLVSDIETARSGGSWRVAAQLRWEESDLGARSLFFEIEDPGGRAAPEDPGNAFLAAAFPLAVAHRERRIRVDAGICPMLADGLRAVHGWWRRWGGLPQGLPAIEAAQPAEAFGGPPPQVRGKTATALLSGGLDSLHLLWRNRQRYREGDPAYLREALFVHGYDIGRRARRPELRRWETACALLRPLTQAMRLDLLRCRSNLRHLPTPPGFWLHRYNGAALAAAGHAGALAPAFVFIAGTSDIHHAGPLGLHPSVDGLYSSQRVTIVPEGALFSRLEKMRELKEWPEAIDALRVCPVNAGELVNCGCCDACLCTRLELAVLGIEETRTFGRNLMTADFLEAHAEIDFPFEAQAYVELIEPLRQQGLASHAAVIERKLAAYRTHPPPPWSAP